MNSSILLPGDWLALYLIRQIEWSKKIFGEDTRVLGITKHIEKELEEIRANPTDKLEWIDVMILAMDGFWRNGGTPQELAVLLVEKQLTNMAREWPTMPHPDEPSEHVRAES